MALIARIIVVSLLTGAFFASVPLALAWVNGVPLLIPLVLAFVAAIVGAIVGALAGTAREITRAGGAKPWY